MISQLRNNLRMDEQEEYNCSLSNSAGLPIDWSTRGTRHVFFGLFCIAYSLFAIPFYSVNASIIWKMRRTHTYKIMFYLAVSDIGELLCNAFIFGILLINGEVYCKHPKLNFVHAIFSMLFFFSSSCTCMILAFNRFVEFMSKKWLNRIFEGSKTWALLTIPFSYAAFCSLFTPPFFVDSIVHTYQANPRISDKYEASYYSYIHIVNNVMNPIVTFSLYLIMLVNVMTNLGQMFDVQKTNSVNRAALMLTIQSGLVITIHMTTCIVYVLIQFIETPHFILYTAHIGFMLVHGLPPVIYVLFNSSVRHALRVFISRTSNTKTILSPSSKNPIVIRVESFQ